LSLTIICAGIALAMGKVWPLVLVVLPWAAMNWAVATVSGSPKRDADASPDALVVDLRTADREGRSC
jgi:hypothetical protein